MKKKGVFPNPAKEVGAFTWGERLFREDKGQNPSIPGGVAQGKRRDCRCGVQKKRGKENRNPRNEM